MADASATVTGTGGVAPRRRRGGSGSLARVARFTVVRLLALFLTVVVGVYLTILIANMGGYVDELRRSTIRENVSLVVGMDPELRRLPPAERIEHMESLIAIQEERLGLNRPFLLRSFAYLGGALTLDLGRSEFLTSDSGSREVRLIILERLGPTLLLFATGQLLLFFLALLGGLVLSRRYGGWMDRLVIALAPTSAAPSWFYGIFLILIFSAVLGVMPFGGMVSSPPPPDPIDYALSLLKHLVLPVTAIVISAVFLSIYSYRTFFLIFASEDYVEMAKAKGLSSQAIERRYVLRPTLPNIVTQFAFLIITLWSGAIITETVFNWPGLGRTLYGAITVTDVPIIVATTVIYAYLLAVTVFLLDFVYAIVDPRVKLDVGGAM
ncbi:MAG: ABC transporter permease [Trueperaceae bacterium]|nr:ABC transporter permease [Trueperaceae bacterium]